MKQLGVIGLIITIAFSVQAQEQKLKIDITPPSYIKKETFDKDFIHEWYHFNEVEKEPLINTVRAQVDWQNERIVLSANIVNRNNIETATDELLFGGPFNPVIATDLKPLTRSKIKAFVQVRCETTLCNSFVVAIGFRNRSGNPFAYNEQRFVLNSIGMGR